MLYKRLVAFVMAYSFTEDFDSQPGMIPMADILNHSVNNNAYLIFGEDDMKMVALKKIKKVFYRNAVVFSPIYDFDNCVPLFSGL